MQNTYTWTAQLASLIDLKVTANPILDAELTLHGLNLTNDVIGLDQLGCQRYLAAHPEVRYAGNKGDRLAAAVAKQAQFKQVMAGAKALDVLDCAKWNNGRGLCVSVVIKVSSASSVDYYHLTRDDGMPWTVYQTTALEAPAEQGALATDYTLLDASAVEA